MCSTITTYFHRCDVRVVNCGTFANVEIASEAVTNPSPEIPSPRWTHPPISLKMISHFILKWSPDQMLCYVLNFTNVYREEMLSSEICQEWGWEQDNGEADDFAYSSLFGGYRGWRGWSWGRQDFGFSGFPAPHAHVSLIFLNQSHSCLCQKWSLNSLITVILSCWCITCILSNSD